MEGYDSTKDYKTLHLEWLRNNKGFRPKTPALPSFTNYYEQMENAYHDGHIKFNETAYMYLRDDYAHSKRSKSVNAEVAEMFGDKIENKNPKFFITFNWADHNFDIPHALKGVEKLFSKDWVDEARGVFEYHTEGKNHPHFMCILQVNKNKTYSKIKEKMLASALANGLAPNFISVMNYAPRHADYLDLDKQGSKQEYLDKDVLWREENGLAHEYKK